MGLDHGLYKKIYTKKWDHIAADKQMTVTVSKGSETIRLSNPVYVLDEVITLRKANAIHNWFVENVQDGNDNCEDYYVSRSQLTELLDTINKVLVSSKLVKGKVVNGYNFKDGKREPIMEDGKFIKDPSLAAELLPTGSGFFFGSTEYDEWYYQDLKDTAEAITTALEDDQAESFQYWSSW
jgi:hypothetical protein